MCLLPLLQHLCAFVADELVKVMLVTSIPIERLKMIGFLSGGVNVNGRKTAGFGHRNQALCMTGWAQEAGNTANTAEIVLQGGQLKHV
jgi:hypothetical protein